MAKRKINWTVNANLERKEILQYWIKRNKSKTYSIKLNKLFIETVAKIADEPMIGGATDFDPKVRLKVVRDYLIFYGHDDKELRVLAVWSGFRDKESIEI